MGLWGRVRDRRPLVDRYFSFLRRDEYHNDYIQHHGYSYHNNSFDNKNEHHGDCDDNLDHHHFHINLHNLDDTKRSAVDNARGPLLFQVRCAERHKHGC